MHYFMAVLVQDDAVDVDAYVARVMERYSEERQVEPYKEYLDDGDIKAMAKHCGFRAEDAAREAPTHMQSYFGVAGGVDEWGIYRWSTYNPESKWDWYTSGGRFTPLRPGVRVRSLPDDFHCWGIVDLDGKWWDRGEFWTDTPYRPALAKFRDVFRAGEHDADALARLQAQVDAAWDAKRKELLAQHRDTRVVGLDCHM